MFRALADAGINIQMISTSEIKISVLVDRPDGAAALRTVHQAFALEKEPPGARDYLPATSRKDSDAVAIVARLASMEELTIDDISLDETQARLTLRGVQNKPGVAAAIFDAIADAGIFVDMIVQSFGGDETANLGFTVPQAQFAPAEKLLTALSQKLGCGPISSSPRVARLSVSGIGMRSHAAVAIRTFECLAKANINVDMINTSEVRVNVVVDGRHGGQALASLQQAFAENQR
jgi:aspartate kinase